MAEMNLLFIRLISYYYLFHARPRALDDIIIYDKLLITDVAVPSNPRVQKPLTRSKTYTKSFIRHEI